MTTTSRPTWWRASPSGTQTGLLMLRGQTTSGCVPTVESSSMGWTTWSGVCLLGSPILGFQCPPKYTGERFFNLLCCIFSCCCLCLIGDLHRICTLYRKLKKSLHLKKTISMPCSDRTVFLFFFFNLIYHAFHIKGFRPEWYVLTIYQCRDIPYWWETLVKPSGTLIHRQTTVKSISPRGSV